MRSQGPPRWVNSDAGSPGENDDHKARPACRLTYLLGVGARRLRVLNGMARQRLSPPFTDKQLGIFEGEKRTDSERRLIATIREREQRQPNNHDDSKIKALTEEVERLRKENERLLVDVAKESPEGKSIEPRESELPRDPNKCCIECSKTHGPYSRRWFNRIGNYCVCLKCQRTWEATP